MEIQTGNNSFIHSGVVTKINGNVITVSLNQNINCEGCKAKSSCGMSDAENKVIEVLKHDSAFKINEPVKVILKKAVGLKAVFWAYVFPFILMFTTLALSSQFYKEWLAGIISLIILIPYYMLLFILKNNIKKVFEISILKI